MPFSGVDLSDIYISKILLFYDSRLSERFNVDTSSRPNLILSRGERRPSVQNSFHGILARTDRGYDKPHKSR